MRLPRVTVRRLMALVATVALTLSFSMWVRERHRTFRIWARLHHSGMAARVVVEGPRGITIWVDSFGARVSPEADRWHALLARKYDFAARYPWLPVAPIRPNRNESRRATAVKSGRPVATP